MKKFFLFILLFTFAKLIPAKVNIPFSIELSTEAKRYKFFQIFLISKSDTAVKINSLMYPIISKKFEQEITLKSYNTLEIYYSKNASDWEKETLDFELNGKEKSVECEINFLSHSEIMEEFVIKRNYNAKDILIIDDWSGLIGDSPKYKIINNSNLILNSFFNEFWGDTYKFVNNAWIFESVGGICGTRSDGPTFKPGDTVVSAGTDFIGEDYAVQDKGKYKYVVEMCTGDALRFWKPRPKNYPAKNVYDFYYLEKEFEVSSDFVFYPRSTYVKKDLKGIKNIEPKSSDSIK